MRTKPDTVDYVLSTLALLGLIALFTWSAKANAAEVEPVAVYDHTSNLFRGRPFNDKEELTADYVGGGVTIVAGRRKRYEIDITHGVARYEGSAFEQASKLSVRFYPRRGR